MAVPPRPDVFAYLDYREYLRDYYAFGKEAFNLSHRGLARRVGVKSPSFLKLVMDGQRNLSPETAMRVAKACQLEGEPAEFFVSLVRFNQAEEREARDTAYRRLHRFAGFRRVQFLDVARDAYHAHWYYPAIREMAASPGFREDPEWIARTLRPHIKPAEARKALTTLETLGLLRRGADGKLVQTDALVSSGAETGSIHVGSFHRAMIGRGAAAIDEFSSEERDISSLTLCVDRAGIARLKERIQTIRHEMLLESSDMEGPPMQVVQINFQVFPLSDPMEES